MSSRSGTDLELLGMEPAAAPSSSHHRLYRGNTRGVRGERRRAVLVIGTAPRHDAEGLALPERRT